MKFWQKIFISSMLLFTVSFDIGAYILVTESYKESMQREVYNSVREENIIASSLQSSISNMQQVMNTYYINGQVLNALVQSLADYYKDDYVTLQMYYGKESVFSNLPRNDENWVAKLGPKEQVVENQKIDGKRYMFVVSQVPGYSNLTVVYARNISDIDVSREKTVKVFILVSTVVVLLFGVIIYWLLRRFTKPVDTLVTTTSKIAAGNYEERIILQSSDEFGTLSEAFNTMAEAVEEKIYELTEQALNKQIFIDDLAHEMKTPMTSIMGYSSLLMKANLNEEQRENAVSYIHSSADRLTKLSEKLLELANLTSDQLEIVPIDVDVLLGELKEQVIMSLNRRNISLQMDSSLKSINGDKTLLISMMSNLVENAARASKPGNTITVKVYDETVPVIEVQDEGCGMPEAEIEKILQPFYKLDKARTRENGGAGLGLSIVKKIATVHHAQIAIDSKLGEGTTVKVLFNHGEEGVGG